MFIKINVILLPEHALLTKNFPLIQDKHEFAMVLQVLQVTSHAIVNFMLGR